MVIEYTSNTHRDRSLSHNQYYEASSTHASKHRQACEKYDSIRLCQVAYHLQLLSLK